MRLFIAVQFDNEILTALQELQRRWIACGMKGHPTSSENFHLTLAFIGEYGNPGRVADAIESVRFSPFSLKLDGAGHFRDTYWAGVAVDAELTNYVRRLRRALAENNIPYDRKKFAPHITLIRRAEFDGDIAKLLEFSPQGEMTAAQVVLMRSDRGKNGMIYTPLKIIGADEND